MSSRQLPARWRLSRRRFLQVGSIGAAGLTLGNVMQAESADAGKPRLAKNVIMVFLTGGPATIDMWDMKPKARESVRGEFRPISTSVPGVEICEHMPRLAKAMQHATLIRSVTHTIAEHTEGQRYVMTGNTPSSAVEYASLGALASCLVESTSGVPCYATIGDVPSATSGDLGATFNPFLLTGAGGSTRDSSGEQLGLPDGFTPDDLTRRLTILERIDHGIDRAAPQSLAQLNRFQSDAAEILRSNKISQALRIDQEPEAQRNSYGRSTFAMQALAARRLIEAGARFVAIGLGDWDTHLNNFTRMRQSLLPELDQGLAALLTNLADRGLLDETIVYCTGEFARTPFVNGSAGRDHWARSMTSLVAGGGFRPGFVYGETDEECNEPSSGACSPDDVSATIFRQLGFEPSHTVTTRAGRPIPLFRHGKVIDALT